MNRIKPVSTTSVRHQHFDERHSSLGNVRKRKKKMILKKWDFTFLPPPTTHHFSLLSFRLSMMMMSYCVSCYVYIGNRQTTSSPPQRRRNQTANSKKEISLWQIKKLQGCTYSGWQAIGFTFISLFLFSYSSSPFLFGPMMDGRGSPRLHHHRRRWTSTFPFFFLILQRKRKTHPTQSFCLTLLLLVNNVFEVK